MIFVRRFDIDSFYVKSMYSFNFFFLKVPRAFVVLRPGIEETEENLTNLMESRLEVSTHVRGASLECRNDIRFLSAALALRDFE